MRKVKTFLSVWQNSLFPNDQLSRKIIRFNFGFSYRYYLLLILSLHLLFSALFLFPRLLKINQLKNSLFQTINLVPDRLTIFFDRGLVWSNLDHPYLAWTDFDRQKILLFVLDENAGPNKINQYHSLMMLTRDYFVLTNLGSASGFAAFPVSRTTNLLTVNKTVLMNARGEINSFLIVLALGLSGLIIFGGVALVFVCETAWLIVLSAMIRLILRRRRASFVKLLQIAFHAATFPLALTYILILLQIPIMAVVRVNLILTIIYLVGAVYETYLGRTPRLDRSTET
ncbi:DUF1189 family protein [Patescibacteria group bacterium]|nr:DUF1189 family protein [Patescibacteria group bacterium]MCL5091666.1 DUF1189 family protein [Patescibacteria group bacterium]